MQNLYKKVDCVRSKELFVSGYWIIRYFTGSYGLEMIIYGLVLIIFNLDKWGIAIIFEGILVQ